MYVAIINGVVHYSAEQKKGYQELKGTSSIPRPLEEELRSQIADLREQQNTTDAALQELILITAEA